MSLTPGQSHAGTYFLEVVLGWFDRSHHFNLESIAAFHLVCERVLNALKENHG